MIKDNQKYLNRMQVVLDGLVIIASYALAWYLRFRSGLMEVDGWYLPFEIYMRALTYIVPQRGCNQPESYASGCIRFF